MERIEEEQWRVCSLCNEMSGPESNQWLQACQCPQPYHRQCLQYYVWKCETRRPPKAPACPWCLALYRVQPSKGIFINALEKIAFSWYPQACDLVAFLTCQGVMDAITTIFGFNIVSTVYGFDEAYDLLVNMDPLVAVITCHSLPLIFVIINYIPWEEHLLRCLRTCNRLPVIGALMPRGGPELQSLKRRSVRSWDAVMGGLLLPSFANLTGVLLFSTEQSPVKRFLLGGAFFLVARGIAYMYYLQKKFIRLNYLTVANYEPSAINGDE